jgi:hypothetical protein
MIKQILLYLPILLNGFSLNEPGEVKFIVGEETDMSISGSTSVSSFQCKGSYLQTSDTLSLKFMKDSLIFLIGNGRLIFRLNDIECGDTYSNNQLKRTLKGDQYPFIIVDLLSVHPVSENWLLNTITVRIELAGNIKIEKIPVEFNEIRDGSVSFSGEHSIQMSTYDLVPPKPMMGLIEVNDRLDISFNLWVRPL